MNQKGSIRISVFTYDGSSVWVPSNSRGVVVIMVSCDCGAAVAYKKELCLVITWQEDRPLFVQFGANDPELLLKAAMFVQDDCDYVDINLG